MDQPDYALEDSDLAGETDNGSLFRDINTYSKEYLKPLSECMAASGYSFRRDVYVTPRQLRKSCAASGCIELANGVMTQYEWGFPGNELPMRTWAHPMIDYCMLHFIALDDPCPSDPVAQLLLDMKPITDACEAQANVSIIGIIQGAYNDTDRFNASSNSSEAPGVTDDSSIERMCAVPECDNIVYRVHMLYWRGLCGADKTTLVSDKLIQPYRQVCDTDHRATWFQRSPNTVPYVYLPGPLPPTSPVPIESIPVEWQRESDPESLFFDVENWYLRARDECIAESEFAFRKDVPVTPRQLHNSCAASACIDLANTVITNYHSGYLETGPALRQWVYPLIEYCMFYHIPGDPCPSDPVAQLLADIKPISSVCETQANVSILGIIQGDYTGSSSATVDVAGKSHIERMCDVPECDNTVYRINVMYWNNYCGLKSLPSVRLALIDKYTNVCDTVHRLTWYNPREVRGDHATQYVYMPGPLPLSPLPSPSSSTPTKTRQPSLSLIVPSEGLPSSPSASDLAPTSNLRNAKGPAHFNASSSSLDKDTITTPPIGVNDISAPPPPSLASVADDDTRPPESTATSSKTLNRGSTALQFSLISVVVVAFMILAFAWRHRHRQNLHKRERTPSSPDTGGAYRTLGAVSHLDAKSDRSCDLEPLLTIGCPQLLASQLVDLRIIGGGGFGVVYLVRDTQNDRLLASKRLTQRSHQQVSNDELDAFVAEINMASSLSHDRIVSFVGVAGLRKTALQALFEYMDGGDLKQYLDQRPIEDKTQSSWTPEKLQIAVDVADALVYLHTLEPTAVVHRDLKSRNVMLTSEKRAKLGDFGVSRTESAVGSMTTGVGTSRWVAPEVILGGGDYTTACDIYSFGVVLSELDTHRLPFAELTHGNGEPLADFAVLELVATERQQPSFSQTCPSRMLTLAKRCLSFEPGLRPSAVEIAAELRVILEELGKSSVRPMSRSLLSK